VVVSEVETHEDEIIIQKHEEVEVIDDKNDEEIITKTDEQITIKMDDLNNEVRVNHDDDLEVEINYE
jgi:hypothetical protein